MSNKHKISYLIIGIIVGIISGTSVAYAATGYLYNADEVTYDKTNSSLTATDVQNAIDELYTSATDYTSVTSRISALENNLPMKTLDSTTINNTAGSFTFTGSGDPWSGTDWVGLQIGDAYDKFQVTMNNENLIYRQNDSGGTNTSWGNWVTALSKKNVKYGIISPAFSSGKTTIAFSTLGISTRPNTMLLIPAAGTRFLLTYLWDDSSSNVVINCYDIATKTTCSNGNIKFVYAIFPN